MCEILSQLRPGDHAALFYRNRAERFEVVVPFIQLGLERNERCLYVADENSVKPALLFHRDIPSFPSFPSVR